MIDDLCLTSVSLLSGTDKLDSGVAYAKLPGELLALW